MEFLDKLAVLIPPPRKHRHRYHGVLAPNALLRQAVTACTGLPITGEVATNDPVLAADKDPAAAEPKTPSYAASLWAMLIARIYEVLPLVCPQCGDELKIVAFLTETAPIQRILIHLCEPARRLASNLLALHPTGWTRIWIKRTRMNQKQRSPYRNLTNRQERRFARLKAARRVVYRDVHHEFDQTVSW